MKILITGNQGYLGPVVCRVLRHFFPHATLIGFDSGFFSDCLSVSELSSQEIPDTQISGDVRGFPPELLSGVYGVVHLAALSNDPMGKQFEEVTEQINFLSTISLAKMARKAGVRRFVFASSCSVYGLDDGHLKTEKSDLHPLTAYARSKVDAEKALCLEAGEGFLVSALRFATACGFSPRCRLDLVLNDFVASAIRHKEIILLSDGTPWRPLIHLEDMGRAIAWGLTRERTEGGEFIAVNVGSAEWNYRIGELAQAVADQFRVPVRQAPSSGPDRRSYRVDFSLFKTLAPAYQPLWSLKKTVEDLKSGLGTVLAEPVQLATFARLFQLSELIRLGRLTPQLQWS